MNSSPNKLATIGYMCEVAYYNYSLQDMQIFSRYNFTTKYKIFGYTTLQSVPASVKLVVLDTDRHEKVVEDISKPDTGRFEIVVPSNRTVVVIAQIPGSLTTQYKIYGPIKPSEYIDNHLT
jgi:hypothetical protein